MSPHAEKEGHSHQEHHETKPHAHHHHKFNEHPDGRVYHPSELEAYKVNLRNLNRCVNLFVPYKICEKTLSPLEKFGDPKRGKCSKEAADLLHCVKINNNFKEAFHVQNMYFNATGLATAEGVSPTLSAKYYKSPLYM